MDLPDRDAGAAQRQLASKPVLCPNCGYDLWRLATARCPECGRDFSAAALEDLAQLKAEAISGSPAPSLGEPGWGRPLNPWASAGLLAGVLVLSALVVLDQGLSDALSRSSAPALAIGTAFLGVSLLGLASSLLVLFLTRTGAPVRAVVAMINLILAVALFFATIAALFYWRGMVPSEGWR